MTRLASVEWRALYVLHEDITVDDRRAVAAFLNHSGLATKEEVRAFLLTHGRRGLDAQLALPITPEQVPA